MDINAPFNGSWLNHISYQIDELQQQLNGYLSGGTGECCVLSGSTGSTDVIINEYIIRPQETITIIERVPPSTYQLPPNVIKKTCYITLPPKIVTKIVGGKVQKICDCPVKVKSNRCPVGQELIKNKCYRKGSL